MSALLISNQPADVESTGLHRNYAALLPGATAIGAGAVELSGLERTIFISVQS